MSFRGVKVGDKVCRMLAGTFPMDLIVTEITPDCIVCGDWTFDRDTGMEEDHELEWGKRFGVTGSYLVKKEPNRR